MIGRRMPTTGRPRRRRQRPVVPSSYAMREAWRTPLRSSSRHKWKCKDEERLDAIRQRLETAATKPWNVSEEDG